MGISDGDETEFSCKSVALGVAAGEGREDDVAGAVGFFAAVDVVEFFGRIAADGGGSSAIDGDGPSVGDDIDGFASFFIYPDRSR